MKPRVVAFIPARSGSKRVPDKNIKILSGHPMLAYSICAALDSGIFDTVICATDSERYAEIARHYGAEVPFLRPVEISGDKSPDIEWVVRMLENLKALKSKFDAFSILRPTSPFRLPQTIQRAWSAFLSDPTADSLRAVEKCKQHPGKMWVIQGNRMLPLLPFTNGSTPWHSSQYAALPDVYSQDASLEIAWSKVPLEQGSIAGQSIIPFVSSGYEGFDINEPEDWWMAERLLANRSASLPSVSKHPFGLNG
jgi:N-acylneuraminate cytidylyltransferase